MPKISTIWRKHSNLLGAGMKRRKLLRSLKLSRCAESVREDNSNRELIFYYADHAHQPAKALDIARQEFARRHDVYTLDAYAWALHVNGRNGEARKQIEAALSVGIRDAKMLRHAGEIALQLGDRGAAHRYLQESASLNAPGSDQARVISTSLTQLQPKR